MTASESNSKLLSFLVKACPELVNTRAVNGVTPLHIACRLGRTKYVKILLEAGADQSIKDSSWKNLLHSALHFRPTAARLKTLLDLLDRDLVISMMTERCSLADNARTPLHELIYSLCHGNSYSKDEKAIDVLKFLMDLSPEDGKRALWMVDGTGDTPLHTLVSSDVGVSIVRAVLDIDPGLLFRENAVGRTPLEVAHDRFFADKTKAPNDHARSWYRQYDNQEPKLVTADLKKFVKSDGEDESDEQTPVAVIWKLCAEYELKVGTKKRKLVSLHEANDVAERLGEGYMGDRYKFKLPEVVGEEGETAVSKENKFGDFVTERYENHHDAWEASKDYKEEFGTCRCGGDH